MSQVNQLEVADGLTPHVMLVDLSMIRDELGKARESHLMSFDTETTSLMEFDLRMLGFSFAYYQVDGGLVSWYVPITHTVGLNAPVQVLDLLKEVLEDKTVRIVMHNAKYDMQVVQKYGIRLGDLVLDDLSRIEDTMIMAKLIDENRESVGLKQLSLIELDYRQQTLEEVAGKDLDMESIPSYRIAPYAADDAGCTLMLFRKFLPIMQEHSLCQVYDKIERPLIPVLSNMAKNGVKVDVGLVHRLDTVCHDKAYEYQELVFSRMGVRINLNSPKQLGEALYDRMRLPVLKSTKGGSRSCDSDTLDQLMNLGNDIAGDIVKYRWFTKMKGTFLSGLMPIHDGKIFPQFHQSGTVTGRLSSSGPNMQNYPAESDLGVRACVIPYEGDIMGCADYSQIELRLAAHFSKDKNMMQGFLQGADIHQWTADLMRIERRHAKCVDLMTWIQYNGEYKRIQSIFTKFSDDTFYEDCGVTLTEGTEVKVKNRYCNGVGKRIQIVSKRGVLVSSPSHRVKMLDGSLKSVEDLIVGDALCDVVMVEIPNIQQVKRYNFFNGPDNKGIDIRLDGKYAYIAGMYTGDGCYGKKHVNIAVGSGEKYELWKDEIVRAFYDIGVVATKKDKIIYVGSTSMSRFFQFLELNSDKGKTLRIPEWVMNNRENAWEFLAGLTDTDGTVGNKLNTISITTKSILLAQDLCVLLNGLGLFYYLEECLNKTYNRIYYRVYITAMSNGVIKDNLKLRCPWKKNRVAEFKIRDCNKTWLFKRKNNEVTSKTYIEDGLLLDLEVDSEEHLYWTNGIITHNTINFGILYGMSAPSLAANLGVDRRQAQEYIDGWFGTYSGIQDFKRWAEGFVNSKGYVTTLSGRRRHLPDVKSEVWTKRGYALRQALNSIVQGSGADLLKYSMVKIADKYKQRPPVRIFSNVHDELLFSFDPVASEEVAEDCKLIMENCVKLEVPVVVDMAVGKNWWIAKYQNDVAEGKVLIPDHIRSVC